MANVEIIEQSEFFKLYENRMFYVAFLKAKETWFPLCTMQGTSNVVEFNTLYVSSSKNAMEEIANFYVQEVPEIEQTLIHRLMSEEVLNLLERYGLKYIAHARPDAGEGENETENAADG